MYEHVKQVREQQEIQSRINSLENGTVMHLKLNTPSGPDAFPSKLLGQLPGQYFIVSIDEKKISQHRSFFLQYRSDSVKSKVIVRYLLEEHLGEIAAFSSEILSITPSHNILLISFPRRIEILRLRQEPRSATRRSIELCLPVAIATDQKIHIPSEIIDLSKSGCCIEVGGEPEVSLEKGGSAYLVISGNTKDAPPIKAEVRNIKQLEGFWRVGLQFTEREEASIDELFDTLPQI